MFYNKEKILMNMTINIYPEDIVRRCLWDTYVYYVIGGSEKEAERILKEINAIVENEMSI